MLQQNIRQQIFTHIRDNARLKGIYLAIVNGYTDHVHVLLSLSPDQTIARVVQLIKGESSFWINQNKLTPQKFEWQTNYFAVSVSESGLYRVKEYIRNQEEHHARKSFQQEYEEFIEKYGFVEMLEQSS